MNQSRRSCLRCKHVSCTCSAAHREGTTSKAGKSKSQQAGSSAASAGGEDDVDLSGDGSLGIDTFMEAPSSKGGADGGGGGGDDDKGDPGKNPGGPRELRLGEKALALWRGGTGVPDWRECDIIEKQTSRETGLVTMYYVHWTDFNRRNDSWVKVEDIDMSSTKEKIKEVRDRKRNFDEYTHDHDEHEGMDDAALKEHEEVTKVKNVNKVQIGKFLVETWYFTPLPREVWKAGDEVIETLYLCEFSLNFYKTKEQLRRHQAKDEAKKAPRYPPGDEIYRSGKVSVFEVDGTKSQAWCQNLCYLAKMFLDHKTLYYDVDPFLFYVICESDEQGYHIVGYFSKEKESEDDYNLACILTFPQYQRKGYGKFIISFSYELSKIERKAGTPERPLSDLGKEAYHSHWNRVLLHTLREVVNRPDPEDRFITLQSLSDMTAFKTEDIKQTLERLQLLIYVKGQWAINCNPTLIDMHLSRVGGQGVPVDPTKIVWTPHINIA